MEIKHYGNILVENLKEIINYNINIIDTSGIIVASTDSQRVGDFHLIGKECVENKPDNKSFQKGKQRHIRCKGRYKPAFLPQPADNRCFGYGVTNGPSLYCRCSLYGQQSWL